ncbi:MAG: helix-turn-helix transcriptional regulator [Oscillospiraceae bacterium]|nr:helix-turn-helix transcriptional regulator [Oscillospiraceae bacterium]
MQNETASTAFLEYGSVYKLPIDEKSSGLIRQTKRITAQRYLSQFLLFDCDTYVEVQSGIGILLVSHDPEKSEILEFGMNRRIHIKPNVYYGFVATTPELVIDLYAESSYSMDVATLPVPYEFRPVLPRIQIKDILGYYYRIRTPGYHFNGEQHPFFELTYIDTGVMYTEVDGVRYRLGEKDMILYGPNQFHTQYTDENQSVSYITIMFNMENLAADMDSGWYDTLINKVFPYNKKTYTLLKTFVRESTTGVPYMDSLMLCLLSETIIRLLQGEYVVPTAQPASVVRQNYQDELFDRIHAYIENNICEPLTIAEICQQFSLSRSSLQLLFKNAVNQSPKKYISDMKLEKSCQMLRENKYTISEISLKLGYSSIHYFSNAFNQKYRISPSEYAKRIY